MVRSLEAFPEILAFPVSFPKRGWGESRPRSRITRNMPTILGFPATASARKFSFRLFRKDIYFLQEVLDYFHR